MSINKAFSALLLLGLVGCAPSSSTSNASSSKYLTGTVLEELFYSTGSHVPGYTLKVKTEEGVYVFDVSWSTSRSVSVLSMLIDKGAAIRFRADGFTEDRTGYLYASDIEILEGSREE